MPATRESLPAHCAVPTECVKSSVGPAGPALSRWDTRSGNRVQAVPGLAETSFLLLLLFQKCNHLFATKFVALREYTIFPAWAQMRNSSAGDSETRKSGGCLMGMAGSQSICLSPYAKGDRIRREGSFNMRQVLARGQGGDLLEHQRETEATPHLTISGFLSDPFLFLCF